MATRPMNSERVRQWLLIAPKMLDELDEQAVRWDAMPDWEQASWALEWDQFTGYLRGTLEPAYLDGAMSPEQRIAYRDLLRRLKAALPTVRRLDLALPGVAMDAAA